jgi:hypothetical protein
MIKIDSVEDLDVFKRSHQLTLNVYKMSTALPADEKFVDFAKSRRHGRHSKKLQMQGARVLRNEAYIDVRCNDER